MRSEFTDFFTLGIFKTGTQIIYEQKSNIPSIYIDPAPLNDLSLLPIKTMNIIPKGSNRMGFIYNANSQRTGKTLLAKLAIMPVCGQFKAQPWKTKEEELNKILDSQIIPECV